MLLRCIKCDFCSIDRALKSMPNTVSMVMEAMNPMHTEQLAMHILKISSLPRELGNILVSRSQGNPLFLNEIIREMHQQEAVCVNKMKCYAEFF